MLTNCGIYKITCIPNNKVYIGQSKNIQYRFGQHILLLDKNIHYNRHLQFSYNKYGKHNFKFDIIEYCDQSQLTLKESYWINKCGGINCDNIFNVQDVQEPYHFTKEVRDKISNSNKR